MFCTLAKFWSKAKVLAKRALVAVGERLGRLWTSHGARVKRDPAYAATTVLVVGGLFGLTPLRDVLAAILATACGVFMTGRYSPNRTSRDVDRWEEWDIA